MSNPEAPLHLFENRDHATEPTVAERHDKALDHPRLAATEFLQGAEAPEVDFGNSPDSPPAAR
jgi:hypothetical protein